MAFCSFWSMRNVRGRDLVSVGHSGESKEEIRGKDHWTGAGSAAEKREDGCSCASCGLSLCVLSVCVVLCVSFFIFLQTDKWCFSCVYPQWLASQR